MNEKEAEKWYRRSAKQGDPFGQTLIAMVLSSQQSQIHTKNYQQSVAYAKSDRDAQPNLAKQLQFFDLLHQETEQAQKELMLESIKWQLIAWGQGFVTEHQRSRFEEYRKQGYYVYPKGTAEHAEILRRVNAFVPQKETTNDWLTGKAVVSGVGAASSSGSGFFISEDGYLVTNFHVVEDAMRVVVQRGREVYPAELVKVDPANDLALLKVSGQFKAVAIGASQTAQAGNSVLTVGFPNPTLQGVAPKVTDGKISSLSGAHDNPRHFQVSVAVQPGNSGGALVNLEGNVIGIVVARLSEKVALETSGALPQNVNYAIKGSYLSSLIESVPGLAKKLKKPWPQYQRKFEEVVLEAEEGAALVLVY